MSLDHNINENGENCLNANFRVRYSCLQCEEEAIGSHCQKHETEGEEKWCFGVWEQKWKIKIGKIWTLLLRNPRMLELEERDGKVEQTGKK